MSRFKKSGGGFLNGVDGTLVGLKYNEKEWGEGEKAYRTLSAELEILADGAEEPVSQFLPAGFLYEGQTVSDDGSTIDGAEGSCIGENSEFGRFVQSALDSGFDEADLDAEDLNNNQGLVGQRFTFGKMLNKERQLAAGKKKLGAKAKTASEEDIMKAGRRQDKNDKSKFYNHDMLVVTAHLGEAEAAPAKGSKKTAAKAAKPAAAAKGKKAKDAEEDFSAADALLVDLLADAKGNTINKANLSSLIVRKALADDMDNDTRDAFRKTLADETFLSREEGWKYDAKAKGSPITLA